MRLFPPEPVIGPNDGFNEHDIFGYAKLGEQLKEFYGKFDDPLVGVLDAPWGSGKSTFVKMWCGHMRNAGYPVIEFDAFKNDYTDDAFMALAGEVLLLAEDLNGDSEEAKKKFTEKATDVVLAAGKGGLKAFAKKAFTEEGAEEVGAALVGAAEGAVDGLEAAVKEKLQSRRKEKAAFDSFAEALSTLSEHLGKSDVEGVKSKPLIFVIDELDRCKPTFALALLEKIKHFFSVPNVHFLLVTNLDQLSKVVRCEYGSEINGKNYLQKFYNFSFSLPDQLQNQYTDVRKKFLNYINQECNVNICDPFFYALVVRYNMSLRTIVKFYSYAVTSYVGGGALVKVLYISLACMRVCDEALFSKAIDNRLTESDVSDFFAITHGNREYLQGAFLYALKLLPERDGRYKKVSEDFWMRPEELDFPNMVRKVACLNLL